MKTLDAQVFVGGYDISNYVISIGRRACICETTATATITLSPDFSGSVNTYARVVIYEMGKKVFTGNVVAYEKRAAEYTQTIEAADDAVKLEDYWITEAYKTNGETVQYWIGFFCDKVGVDYTFDTNILVYTPSGDDGVEWNYTSVMSIIKELMDSAGYWVYSDADGVIHFSQGHPVKPTLNFTELIRLERSRSLEFSRNRAVVFGTYPKVGEATKSLSYLGDRVKTAIVASPLISDPQTFAQKMVNAFSRVEDKKIVDVEGDPNVTLAQFAKVVEPWSGLNTYGQVSTVESYMGPDTYIMKVTLDQECPKIWGNSLASECARLVAFNYGEGTHMLTEDDSWLDITSNLSSLDIFNNHGACNKLNTVSCSGADLWATLDGRILRSQNGGATWEDYTPDEDPPNAWGDNPPPTASGISYIEYLPDKYDGNIHYFLAEYLEPTSGHNLPRGWILKLDTSEALASGTSRYIWDPVTNTPYIDEYLYAPRGNVSQTKRRFQWRWPAWYSNNSFIGIGERIYGRGGKIIQKFEYSSIPNEYSAAYFIFDMGRRLQNSYIQRIETYRRGKSVILWNTVYSGHNDREAAPYINEGAYIPQPFWFPDVNIWKYSANCIWKSDSTTWGWFTVTDAYGGILSPSNFMNPTRYFILHGEHKQPGGMYDPPPSDYPYEYHISNFRVKYVIPGNTGPYNVYVSPAKPIWMDVDDNLWLTCWKFGDMAGSGTAEASWDFNLCNGYTDWFERFTPTDGGWGGCSLTGGRDGNGGPWYFAPSGNLTKIEQMTWSLNYYTVSTGDIITAWVRAVGGNSKHKIRLYFYDGTYVDSNYTYNPSSWTQITLEIPSSADEKTIYKDGLALISEITSNPGGVYVYWDDVDVFLANGNTSKSNLGLFLEKRDKSDLRLLESYYLGEATLDEVESKTYIAYPHVPASGVCYVYGRLNRNDTINPSGIAHIAITEDSGETFSVLESGWGSNYCSALREYAGSYHAICTASGGVSKYYVDGGYKFTIPITVYVGAMDVNAVGEVAFGGLVSTTSGMVFETYPVSYSGYVDITFDYPSGGGIYGLSYIEVLGSGVI